MFLLRSSTFSPPPYEALCSEVLASRAEATAGKAAWFGESKLRSLVYNYLHTGHVIHNHLGPLQEDPVVTSVSKIWKICLYTALVALTQIAPEESYAGKEEMIFETAIMANEVALAKFPQIQRSLNALENTLNTPLDPGQGLAVVCNLYNGDHSFVIERRGCTCVIYQSYFADKFQGSSYTFDEYLRDGNKHIGWDVKDLMRNLRTITSREELPRQRQEAYRELFFCPPYMLAFAHRDILNTKMALAHKDMFYDHNIAFVATEPYTLRKA
jgi:hypothetical protein